MFRPLLRGIPQEEEWAAYHSLLASVGQRAGGWKRSGHFNPEAAWSSSSQLTPYLQPSHPSPVGLTLWALQPRAGWGVAECPP